MKKTSFNYILLSLSISLLFSSHTPYKEQQINFMIRGNGKFPVALGVGASVGSGSCCRGVSPESYVAFEGRVGDVVWDSKTNRVITKIYKEISGSTIDLRQYY